ncbi:MAG: sigma 54-interacting transcriptional regulator [Bilophila wadsworthia]
MEGAFTGTTRGQDGLFELAHNGTLFPTKYPKSR